MAEPEGPCDRSVVLDGLASGLLAAARFCFIFGLIDGPTNGWSTTAVLLVIAGAAFFCGFAVRQRFARNPLIKPSLLRNRGFTAGLIMVLAFFSVGTGLGYVISLFLQQEMGRTPVQTALGGVALIAVRIIVSSITAAPLIRRLGRYLVLAGLVITLVGVVILWVVVATQGTSLRQDFQCYAKPGCSKNDIDREHRPPAQTGYVGTDNERTQNRPANGRHPEERTESAERFAEHLPRKSRGHDRYPLLTRSRAT